MSTERGCDNGQDIQYFKNCAKICSRILPERIPWNLKSWGRKPIERCCNSAQLNCYFWYFAKLRGEPFCSTQKFHRCVRHLFVQNILENSHLLSLRSMSLLLFHVVETDIHTHIHMHIHIHIHTYRQKKIHAYVRTNVRTYGHIHVRTYKQTRIRKHPLIRLQAHICTYGQTTHTHTYRHRYTTYIYADRHAHTIKHTCTHRDKQTIFRQNIQNGRANESLSVLKLRVSTCRRRWIFIFPLLSSFSCWIFREFRFANYFGQSPPEFFHFSPQNLKCLS